MADYLTWGGVQIVPSGAGYVSVVARPTRRPNTVLVEYPYARGLRAKVLGQGNTLATAQQVVFGVAGSRVTRAYYGSKSAALAAIEALNDAAEAGSVGTLAWGTAAETASIANMVLLHHEPGGVMYRPCPLGDWAVDWFLQFVRESY